MNPQFFDENSSGIIISRYMSDPAAASSGIVDNIHHNNHNKRIWSHMSEMNYNDVDIVNDQNEIVTKDVCIGFKNKDVLYHLRDKFMLMWKGKEGCLMKQ